MKLSTILKVSSILWAIWGVFHLFIGVAMVVLLAKGHPTGDFESIPTLLDFTMFEMTSPFAVVATASR